MTVTRIRRVRTTKPAPKGLTKKQKDDLVDRLNSIANMQTQIEQLQKRMAEEEAEVFVAMENGGIEHLDGDGCFADIVQPSGKSQNIIDPKGLRKALPADADYYACISVSVTKAKEFLGEKELKKITTTIPATPGARKLKVSKIKEK